MRHLVFACMALLALVLAACANRTGDATLAAYCADPGRQEQDLCKVHREIETTRGDVRRNRADIDATRQTADQALSLAQQANLREDGLTCVTRTLRRTDTGTCEAGYVLTSCAQSRYTSAAGGPTVLRDINDERCRFATRVLEMKVRCRHVGSEAPPVTAEVVDNPASSRRPRPTS